MVANAHSDFFGLDLGVGFGPDLPALDPEENARTQATLDQWAEVAAKSLSNSPTASNEASPNLGSDLHAEDVKMRQPSAGPASGSKAAKKVPSPVSSGSGVKGAKVQKTFHFVDNANKTEAARLRNTMTSRNLRQSKVSRIAELERLLEQSQNEAAMWKKRAVDAGYSNTS